MIPQLNLEQAVLFRTYPHDSPVDAVRFDSTGSRLIAGYKDHSLRVWNVDTGEAQPLMFHDNWIGAVCPIPLSDRFVSAGFDGRLAWWEFGAEQPYRSVEAHAGWVRSVASSRDGAFVATAGDDNLVRLWRTETGEQVREFRGSDSFYYSVAFSPDGSQLIAGNLTGSIFLFDSRTGEVSRRHEVPDLYTYGSNRKRHIGGVRSVGFSRDGRFYFGCGMARDPNVDGLLGTPEVYVFDAATGEPSEIMTCEGKYSGMIYDSACHPIEPLLAGCAGGDGGGAIFFWDYTSPKALVDFKLPKHSHTCDFHPDGTVLAAGCTDGTIRLIDLTGTREAEPKPDEKNPDQ